MCLHTHSMCPPHVPPRMCPPHMLPHAPITHVSTPCAHLIISQVSKNTHSELPSLEVHREKKAAFSEMLHRIFPLWDCYSQGVCLGALRRPVLLALHPQPRVQNFSACIVWILLEACCPRPHSAVSAHLVGGDILNCLILGGSKVHLISECLTLPHSM